MKFMFLFCVLFGLACSPTHSEPSSFCPVSLPYGEATFPPDIHPKTVPLCREAYYTLQDDNAHIPVYVTYQLSKEHTLGCVPRDNFHADPDLTNLNAAKNSDYKGGQWDRGHMSPAEDNSWSTLTAKQSFYLSNAVPQNPNNNRGIWRSIESQVRTWAYNRGVLYVIVGPVFDNPLGTIGSDQIVVPSKLFKIIVDPKTNTALAFMLPNQAIVGQSIAEYQTTVDAVQKETRLDFHLPVDATKKETIWDYSSVDYNIDHRLTCEK